MIDKLNGQVDAVIQFAAENGLEFYWGVADGAMSSFYPATDRLKELITECENGGHVGHSDDCPYVRSLETIAQYVEEGWIEEDESGWIPSSFRV